MLILLGALLAAAHVANAADCLGLEIGEERRCAPYDPRDYRYPSTLDRDKAREYGGIYSPYNDRIYDSLRDVDIEHTPYRDARLTIRASARNPSSDVASSLATRST